MQNLVFALHLKINNQSFYYPFLDEFINYNFEMGKYTDIGKMKDRYLIRKIANKIDPILYKEV